MGMTVLAYTASPRPDAASRRDTGYIIPGTGDPDGTIPSEWFSGVSKTALREFLAQDLDHLLIAVPLTPQTTHFLGAEEFAILGKRNAFVTNISRGRIVDQDALIAALKTPASEGGLRGAALDVADPEPLPAESELWAMENVIVTPHVSGVSVSYTERSFDVLSTNLGRRERGESMVNVVDRKRGY
jgi:phosphoglycerate dehydrogenase-like enzyme